MGALIADHIHMLVLIPPKIALSYFIGYLKGKYKLMVFDKYANLKYKLEIDTSISRDFRLLR